MKYLKLEYIDQSLKSNNFSCILNENRLIFTISSPSTEFEKYSEFVMKKFKNFNENQIRPQDFENIVSQYLNNLSGFNNKSSLQKSMYLLERLINKETIDTSTDEKLKHVTMLIKQI